MASDYFSIHTTTPEERKVTEIVRLLHTGAVMLYPTDTGYSLGCSLEQKSAIERIRSIRKLEPNKGLTFMCHSLSNISDYAIVSDKAYKTIKKLIPGPFTFILPATKMIPKLVLDPKKKTSGIRVPDHTLSSILIKELGNPLLSITAKHPTKEHSYPHELLDLLAGFVDIVIEPDREDFVGESTVIDMTTDTFEILRLGAMHTNVELQLQ